ncbi:ATP-binding protein [Streptomyces sp. NPDC057950]|uniref:ATP-binding protein n=1 Tax=Streptomyces sp. NPDC057950 TaxID=3346288 RepID=UPI0036E615E6
MLSLPRHPSLAAHQTALAVDTTPPTTPPVTGPARTAVVALPAEPVSVSIARRWTTDLLTVWGAGADDLDTAALIISELAANAVRYGHAEITVRLLQRTDRLYMCVTDSGAPLEPHRLVIPRELAEHGRGLAIVEALSETVEVTREPGGWRVGAVLHMTTVRTAAAKPAPGVT